MGECNGSGAGGRTGSRGGMLGAGGGMEVEYPRMAVVRVHTPHVHRVKTPT